MNPHDKARHEARMRTLLVLRVDRDGCIKVRPEVLCVRELRGWRLIPRTEVR